MSDRRLFRSRSQSPNYDNYRRPPFNRQGYIGDSDRSHHDDRPYRPYDRQDKDINNNDDHQTPQQRIAAAKRAFAQNRFLDRLDGNIEHYVSLSSQRGNPPNQLGGKYLISTMEVHLRSAEGDTASADVDVDATNERNAEVFICQALDVASISVLGMPILIDPYDDRHQNSWHEVDTTVYQTALSMKQPDGADVTTAIPSDLMIKTRYDINYLQGIVIDSGCSFTSVVGLLQ